LGRPFVVLLEGRLKHQQNKLNLELRTVQMPVKCCSGWETLCKMLLIVRDLKIASE